MKHPLSKPFIALSVILSSGLSGCTTIEGVWSDIKSAKPFKKSGAVSDVSNQPDEADIKTLTADMIEAKAIWSEPDATIITQPIQMASLGPKPLTLRGRYSFDRLENTVDAPISAAEARRLAKMKPSDASFLGAIQLYDYKQGAIYQVYGAPEQVTDIGLEPGEKLISVSAGDTVRWLVGDTSSGSGNESQVHILIKPLETDIKTNLVILTSRRTYYAELEARPDSYMPAIAWNYERITDVSIPLTKASAHVKYASLAPAASLQSIKQPAFDSLVFNYKIKGDRPSWRPVRAFDDGQKTYIQFPKDLSRSEAPPLFVLSDDGKSALVNYRVKGRYYVVDRLFDKAELRLGEKKQTIVRILKDDKS